MSIRMRVNCFSGIFIVLLITSLLFTAVPAWADDSNSEASDLPEIFEFGSNEEPAGSTCQVTLITGDTVTVVTGPDGERHFSVSPVEPDRLGQHFLTIKQDGDTYIIPDGIDLGKTDMELFNIDYLVDEQYHMQSSLPLLVRYLPGLSGPQVQSLEGRVKALGSDTKIYSEVATISTRLGYSNIPASYERLIYQTEVQKIWLDKKVHVQLIDSVPLIGAPAWWDSGYSGAGVEIAILDTGIDLTHPALDDLDDNPGTTDPKVLVNINFSDDTDFEDLYGHGTHVAGIAAGTCAGSDHQGVAPGAWLWNVKVLNQYGSGYESWIINGINFASLGPDGIVGTGDEADVINMSLGDSYKSGDSDPLAQAVEWAVEQGLVVVVAAGNSGSAPYTITTPGVAENAITVGATDKTDVLAGFSSRGPTADARIKPDIVAPGVNINSSVPGGTYETHSGTSMAAPHVAGAAALLLESTCGTAPHGLSVPRFVKDALMCSAEDLGYTVYEQGSGRLDIDNCCGGGYSCICSCADYVLATPASLSLGEIGSGNNTAGGTYTFLTGIDAHGITLTADLINTLTGVDCSGNVTLSPDSFTIPACGEADVSLDIDLTGLPASAYSGKITATIDGDSERTINAIFGFTKKYNVTVHKIDINGNPAQGHPIWVFIEAPSEGVDYVGYTDESGNLILSVTADNFHVISPGTDEANDVSIWTITENVTVSGDMVIELDERDTRVIDFDPKKPGQIPSAKETELIYWSGYKHFGWGDSWWYPSSFATRISSASRFVAGFNYIYYPEADFIPDNPQLVNTGEWHNLVFPMMALSDNLSLQTRLLAVMSPSIDSIADLDNGRIGICADESDWLQTAMNTYGISFTTVILPHSEYYTALNKGTVDAVLLLTHPCPYLRYYISNGTIRLLPWSPEAVTAVINAYPQDIIATRLPQHIYEGQTESIPGYAPSNQAPAADYDNLVHRRASYNTALADERAYWYQRSYDYFGGWWYGHTYLMDAPRERLEWLSPYPVRYYTNYYRAEPYQEWYYDGSSVTYSPGEYSWGIGGHPMKPEINMYIMRVPEPPTPAPIPAPPPEPSAPMAEEEYFLDIWGYLYEDNFGNRFNSSKGPVPVPKPPPPPLIEPAVSTPMLTAGETGYTHIWGYTSEDTPNNTISNNEEYYPGHLTVHQDGIIALDKDIGYYFDEYVYLDDTANFTVEIWGESPLALSTESYTRFNFTADPDSYFRLPELLCDVPGIDLYGVVPDGEVSVKVYATDSSSSIENVGLLYSLDDGSNWIDAGLPVFANGAYIFDLGELQNTFVSLAVTADDEPGNSTYHETYRVFSVGGYGVTVSVNSPDAVTEDVDFTATVDISYVEDLNAGQYDIWFDPAVLRLDDVTDGLINSTNISASYNQIDQGHLRVVNSMGLGKVTGSGYLSVLHFHSIGALGTGSDIDITDGLLSNIDMNSIPAIWTDDHVEVSVAPGDANGDGVVNIFDMTKVGRIILELDDPTSGADANQDGSINIFDMTKIARIILELD